MFYYVILSSLVAARVVARNSQRLNSYLFYAFCLFLFIFVGFRYEVGCDWFSYASYARYGHPVYSDLMAAFQQRDPLFHVLARIISRSDLDFYPAINVFGAAVFFFGVVRLGRGLPDKLSFLLYLFPVAIVALPMSGLRQAIATGFLMLAFRGLIDGRVRTFLLFVLLASGFHGSAFLFIIIWPLIIPVRVQVKISLILLLSVPATLLFLSSATVDTAIDRYTNTNLDAAGTLFRLGLLAIGSAAYFLLFRKGWRKLHPSTAFVGDFSATATFALLIVAVLPVLNLSSVVIDRLGLYLSVFVAFTLAVGPYLGLPPDRRRAVIAMFHVIYVLFFVLWSTQGNKFYICYEPYSSYLTN